MIDRYDYPSKVMFSSVRHPEHVRTALLAGVHVCTMPWGVMKRLTSNALTTVGTNQFVEHTQLMTVRVGQVIRASNPLVKPSASVTDAMVKMTESALGTVTIVGAKGEAIGVFTDGDLRRRLQQDGSKVIGQTLADLGYTENPITISSDALLFDAMARFEKSQIDSIIVVEDGKPIGVLDIQDIVKLGIIGH